MPQCLKLASAVVSLSFCLAVMGTTNEAYGQQGRYKAPHKPSYLTCRILVQTSNDFTQFAGSTVIWADDRLASLRQVPSGANVYGCSREIRKNVCSSFAAEIVDGEKIKEGALTGAFLLGVGGSGVGAGAVLGATLSLGAGLVGKTIKMGQCKKELIDLTQIADRMELDWPQTVSSPAHINYLSFLEIIKAAVEQNIITAREADRILIFTDKMRILVGGG